MLSVFRRAIVKGGITLHFVWHLKVFNVIRGKRQKPCKKESYEFRKVRSRINTKAKIVISYWPGLLHHTEPLKL